MDTRVNNQVRAIIEMVGREFKVDPLLILARGRGSHEVSCARAVCAYMMRGFLPAYKINAILGGRSPSYAAGAFLKVHSRSLKDHEYYMRVGRIADMFGAPWN
jgi:chromosomal replication initiation ATPase DnaA